MIHTSLKTRTSQSFLVLLLSVLALCLFAASAKASPIPIDVSADSSETLPLSEDELSFVERDAFSQASDPNGDSVRLTSLTPPNAATRTTYRVQGGDIVTFVGKNPTNVRTARRAYVIVHGVQRDGADYWNLLNRAYTDAREAGITTDRNSIRIAPNFLSTRMDSAVRTGSRLGWADQDAWAGGDGSTSPAGSSASLFSVLDAYLDALSNRATYPALDTIVFVGHGAGGQAVQRYAVLGKGSRLNVRYVVANPSTNLYFTRDRSRPVNTDSCARYNDFRYGLSSYSSTYGKSLSNSALFKRYLSRDVRYLVGTADTRTDAGDQSCSGRAQGGAARRDRNYDYWAYLHLLAGRSNVPTYPGFFPGLDSRSTKIRLAGSYTSTTAATLANFRTTTFNHQLSRVSGVGHSASGMINSQAGLQAIFG